MSDTDPVLWTKDDHSMRASVLDDALAEVRESDGLIPLMNRGMCIGAVEPDTIERRGDMVTAVCKYDGMRLRPFHLYVQYRVLEQEGDDVTKAQIVGISLCG